jgi:glycosyltransferase involved in cell wall biosynthesis
METARPKVSVCIVTYNQKDYIGQCLQSILDQVADFDFEIVVGDDCSTDGSRQIVQEFASMYPHIVKPILHERNVGAVKNYCAVHALAKGEYVAHCDGDDYFLPSKLSTQAGFLDDNPTCMMAAHRVKVLDGETFSAQTQNNPDFIDIDYLLLNHPCFMNSSMMYRKSAADFISTIDHNVLDFFIYINFVLQGRIGFINESLGVYRRGVGISVSLRLMDLIQEAIDFAECNLGPNKKGLIAAARAKQFRSYGLNSLLRNDPESFKRFIAQAYFFDSGSPITAIIYHLRHAPPILTLSFLTFKGVKSLLNIIRNAL